MTSHTATNCLSPRLIYHFLPFYISVISIHSFLYWYMNKSLQINRLTQHYPSLEGLDWHATQLLLCSPRQHPALSLLLLIWQEAAEEYIVAYKFITMLLFISILKANKDQLTFYMNRYEQDIKSTFFQTHNYLMSNNLW